MDENKQITPSEEITDTETLEVVAKGINNLCLKRKR